MLLLLIVVVVVVLKIRLSVQRNTNKISRLWWGDTLRTKMPDIVPKDENHNVIKSSWYLFFFSSSFWYQKNCILHVIEWCLFLCVFFLLLLLLFLVKRWWAQYSVNRNLNVKPSEYYDYFCTSLCERWIKIKPEKKNRPSNRKITISFGNEQHLHYIHAREYHCIYTCYFSYLVFLFIYFILVWNVLSSFFNGNQNPNY